MMIASNDAVDSCKFATLKSLHHHRIKIKIGAYVWHKIAFTFISFSAENAFEPMKDKILSLAVIKFCTVLVTLSVTDYIVFM